MKKVFLFSVFIATSSLCLGAGGKSAPSDDGSIPSQWKALSLPAAKLDALKSYIVAALNDSSLVDKGCRVLSLKEQKEWSETKQEYVPTHGFVIAVEQRDNPSTKINYSVTQLNSNTFSVMTSDDGKVDFYGGNYFSKDSRSGDGISRIYETKWLIAIQKNNGRILEIGQTVYRGLTRNKEFSSFQCGG